MNGTQTFNMNAADCIKVTADFGTNYFTNICNGTSTAVSWGSADWAIVYIGVAFFVLLFGMFAAIAFAMFRL